jgi:dipeptidase E
MKKMIVASTSTLFGEQYLEYLLPTLENHFKNCDEIVFIPYAQPSGISYDNYTQIVKNVFLKINIVVKGLHEYENPIEAVENARGIFTGGGNTFLLVSQLYENKIMSVLKRIIENGIPYLGTSAGSNIVGLTMQTTNDMPIIHPPSFNTLGLIPFNLNPHYLDANEHSKHMGETREARLNEFHSFNDIPVVGLREGSWLEVKDGKIILKGRLTGRLFKPNESPEELDPETDLSFLGK